MWLCWVFDFPIHPYIAEVRTKFFSNEFVISKSYLCYLRLGTFLRFVSGTFYVAPHFSTVKSIPNAVRCTRTNRGIKYE